MAIIDQKQLAVVFINNQNLPEEGAACIPLLLDFTRNAVYQLDLEQLQRQTRFTILQTVWIDMSASSVNLMLKVAGVSNQVIVAKAGSQGYYNILAATPTALEITCNGGPMIPVQLINVPIPGAVWPPGIGAQPFPSIIFSMLPSAPVIGQLASISDGSTNVWGAIVAGGGVNEILIRWNGFNWTVVGK